MKRLSLSLLGAGLALVVTACGSSGKAATSTSTTATTAQVTPGTTGTSGSTLPTSASTGTTPSTAPSGPAPCTTAQLNGSLGAANGTAGTIYYPLELTNTGTTTCTLQGYPGVSFVTGTHGTQLGAAASRIQDPEPVVTLSPGGSATSVLGIVAAANFANCQQTPVLGLRVYPPNELTALFIAHDDTGCANSQDVILHVQPLTPAS